MNTIAVKDEWYEQKKKLKHAYVFLNESDLTFKEGKKEQMLERLQMILGKSKEEMLQIFALL